MFISKVHKVRVILLITFKLINFSRYFFSDNLERTKRYKKKNVCLLRYLQVVYCALSFRTAKIAIH